MAVTTKFDTNYGSKLPWTGIGSNVEEAKTSEEVMKLAGLDWTVRLDPLFRLDRDTNTMLRVGNYRTTVREDNNYELGVVSNRYQIIQNNEAFKFVDDFDEKGLKLNYETAGTIDGGRRIWVCAKMEETEILGDAVVPYLVFFNTHDGSGSAKVAISPIRVVCENTLNMALHSASKFGKNEEEEFGKRLFTIRHVGDTHEQVREVAQIIKNTDEYLKRLAISAEELRKVKLDAKKINNLVELLIPITPDMGDIKKQNIQNNRIWLKDAMNVDNLQNFKNTGWQFINAVADYVDHAPPVNPDRVSTRNRESKFENIILGHETLDRAFKLVKAA